MASSQPGPVLFPVHPYWSILFSLSVALSGTSTLVTRWAANATWVPDITAFNVKPFANNVVVPGWEWGRNFTLAPAGPGPVANTQAYSLDTGITVAQGKGYRFDMYSFLLGGTFSGLGASVAVPQTGPVLRP